MTTILLVPEKALDELLTPIRAISTDIELISYSENDDVVRQADQAVGVLRWVAGKRYSSLVAGCPAVRWLHTASAGVDHVLTEEVRNKQGLVVTDSGPAFEIAISEFVLGWMLMTSRRLIELNDNQRAHKWESLTQEELAGKTVGIIGLGPIGRGVASRSKAFGMKTLGFRRRQEPAPFVDEILIGEPGLDRLLRESDYIVLAAALTAGTRTLIGRDQFSRMKTSAWIINIARGGMIDEPALVDSLESGKIGGACLDVFATEPLPAESPLWNMPNVHIAPHNSSGWTTGLRSRQVDLYVANVKRFIAGEPLDGVVDIAQGY